MPDPEGASAKSGSLQYIARNTFAVIDSRSFPQIEAMLTTADLPEWDRLQRGGSMLSADIAWCVQLSPGHAFTHWLLQGPGAEQADWGVLVASDASFRPIREHFRDLLEATSPDGVRLRLRWYHGAVLRALLPLCSPTQLRDFFGPVRAVGLRGPDHWNWMRVQEGRLVIT